MIYSVLCVCVCVCVCVCALQRRSRHYPASSQWCLCAIVPTVIRQYVSLTAFPCAPSAVSGSSKAYDGDVTTFMDVNAFVHENDHGTAGASAGSLCTHGKRSSCVMDTMVHRLSAGRVCASLLDSVSPALQLCAPHARREVPGED